MPTTVRPATSQGNRGSPHTIPETPEHRSAVERCLTIQTSARGCRRTERRDRITPATPATPVHIGIDVSRARPGFGVELSRRAVRRPTPTRLVHCTERLAILKVTDGSTATPDPFWEGSSPTAQLDLAAVRLVVPYPRLRDRQRRFTTPKRGLRWARRTERRATTPARLTTPRSATPRQNNQA